MLSKAYTDTIPQENHKQGTLVQTTLFCSILELKLVLESFFTTNVHTCLSQIAR